MKEPTPRQQEVLHFITSFTELNSCPPTVRETAEHFSISVKAVQDHFTALRKKGYIAPSEGRSRSLKVLIDDPEFKKPYRVPVLGTVAAGLPIFCDENYDGSGYPNNLKGENIPLGARILRLCDVFGALVANRPYREAFSPDKAIRLMIKEIKNFDMECFLALQRAVHSEKFNKLAEIIEENKKSSKNIYRKAEMNLDLW